MGQLRIKDVFGLFNYLSSTGKYEDVSIKNVPEEPGVMSLEVTKKKKEEK